MSKSILQKPHPKADLSKNGYDIGYRRAFTSPCGMLLPIFKDFASPGEKYRLNLFEFVRTQPLQTAAFVRMRAHTDWFFVPITQIITTWNEFFYGTNDVMSSMFKAPGVNPGSLSKLPTWNFAEFTRNIGNGYKLFFNTPASDATEAELKLDNFGTPLAWNFRRLFDLFGYGNVNRYSDPSITELNYNLIWYCAYHKIFHSHYNLTDWFSNDPAIFNLDAFVMSSNATISTRLPTVFKMLSTLHYRPYKKDYFTNILPQPLFGDQFASFVSNSVYTDNVRSKVNPELTVNQIGGSDGNLLTVTDSNNPLTPNFLGTQAVLSNGEDPLTALSASDVRAAFALDKLMRITAFGGGHYEDQVEAHFGYKMPRGISKEAYYLGSQHVDIAINEVVATASTGAAGAGSTLGDIAGKGYAMSHDSKDIEFEAPCHGVVMAIHSIEPLPDYATVGCETQNRYTESLDFYHSELDNVGMQPMFDTLMGPFVTTENMSTLVGWTYRYAELKTGWDKVNEGFYDNTSLTTWTCTKQDAFSQGQFTSFARFFICPQYTNNIFLQDYIFQDASLPPVTDEGESNALRRPFIPIANTKAGNSVFAASKNSSAEVYLGDNFLINAQIKCYKVSPMSVHSLPKML